MRSEVQGAKRGKSTAEPLDPIQAAADCGIDIQQLRDNLGLPVAERLRRHEIALNAVELLPKARRL